MECMHDACQRRGQALSTSPKTNRRSSRPSNRSSHSQCATSRRTLRTYGGQDPAGSGGPPNRCSAVAMVHPIVGQAHLTGDAVIRGSGPAHGTAEHVGGRGARVDGPALNVGLPGTADGSSSHLNPSRTSRRPCRSGACPVPTYLWPTWRIPATVLACTSSARTHDGRRSDMSVTCGFPVNRTAQPGWYSTCSATAIEPSPAGLLKRCREDPADGRSLAEAVGPVSRVSPARCWRLAGASAPTIFPCFVPGAREESRVWCAAGTRRIDPARRGA